MTKKLTVLPGETSNCSHTHVENIARLTLVRQMKMMSSEIYIAVTRFLEARGVMGASCFSCLLLVTGSFVRWTGEGVWLEDSPLESRLLEYRNWSIATLECRWGVEFLLRAACERLALHSVAQTTSSTSATTVSGDNDVSSSRAFS